MSWAPKNRPAISLSQAFHAAALLRSGLEGVLGYTPLGSVTPVGGKTKEKLHHLCFSPLGFFWVKVCDCLWSSEGSEAPCGRSCMLASGEAGSCQAALVEPPTKFPFFFHRGPGKKSGILENSREGPEKLREFSKNPERARKNSGNFAGEKGGPGKTAGKIVFGSFMGPVFPSWEKWSGKSKKQGNAT